MRQLLPNVIAVALLAACGVASAADTTTFNVKLIVTKACTITAAAATDVDFGSAASTATANVDNTGTLTVQCTPLTPYTVALNAGSNAGTTGDVTTRRMKNTNASITTNNYVGYQLYSDVTRSAVWGATTGTNTQAGTGLGLNQVYTVYGRITNLAGNNPATGSYQDTVTATITY
ncbi:Spore coat protein U (SCPU) domain-containing protein [Pseudoxanthomonas sp. GM95]|uniref:Csu type fimbrial protein n=1 Tax=Pseudoxanthomonas sp. GM95 TaxID=1881043 RepID=UPI0008BD38D7|nr:spore coat U domain-containing protein [Pseudoxanthomonas sp. GM95]SEL80522.1 Spore coat protein U (SCPU) domain-containing protein [Pseudoxanthomonas sp. GM95]